MWLNSTRMCEETYHERIGLNMNGWIVGGDWCGVAGGSWAPGRHPAGDVAAGAAPARLRPRHRLRGVRRREEGHRCRFAHRRPCAHRHRQIDRPQSQMRHCEYRTAYTG